jgi:hypothetical protein
MLALPAMVVSIDKRLTGNFWGSYVQFLFAFACCIGLCRVASEASAQQQKVIYNHSIFWTKMEAHEIFPNQWGVGFDVIHRRRNSFGAGTMFDTTQRTSVRPWINYQFSPYARISLSPLGYFTTNEYYGKPSDTARVPYHELRSTLQFYHHIKQAKGRIMHTWRYRGELRFQERPGEAYRVFTRLRIRYRLRVMLNGNDFYQNNIAYFLLANEIGINYGGPDVPYMFNQNRLYIGFGWRFLNSIRGEIRYVDRLRGRGGSGFEYDHGRGLMLCLYIDQVSSIGRKDIDPVRFVD